MHRGYVSEFVDTNPRPFDAVVSFEVLEHVPDPVAVLRGIHRLLKPGGLALSASRIKTIRTALNVPNPLAMPPIHINFFNRPESRQGVEQCRPQGDSIQEPSDSHEQRPKYLWQVGFSGASTLFDPGGSGRPGRRNNLDGPRPAPLG